MHAGRRLVSKVGVDLNRKPMTSSQRCGPLVWLVIALIRSGKRCVSKVEYSIVQMLLSLLWLL